jgi:hypothetical protein
VTLHAPNILPIQPQQFGGPQPGLHVFGNPGSTAVNGVNQLGLNQVARKVSEGTWTHDLEIIQMPEASTDCPQAINPGIGDCVRIDSQLFMLVNISFELYMSSTYGPSWADHVF